MHHPGLTVSSRRRQSARSVPDGLDASDPRWLSIRSACGVSEAQCRPAIGENNGRLAEVHYAFFFVVRFHQAAIPMVPIPIRMMLAGSGVTGVVPPEPL